LKRLLAVFCAVGLAKADIATVAQPLSITLAAAAKLSVPPSVSLARAAATFQPFTGTMPVQFRVRSSAGGGGNITLQVTSDFAPAGGPSAAAGALTYRCGSSTLGTPCAGVQTAVPGQQRPVLVIPPSTCTGGGGACSQADPNTVQVDFSLENEPGFPTGNYNAQLTFVISSL
jgi:hypothetical protein